MKGPAPKLPAETSNEPSRPEALEEDLPTLSRLVLTGNFAEQVTVIPRSLSSLILATGFLEESGRPVLLPMVEMMFAGVRQGELADVEEDSEPKYEQVFSRTLPLENALWLVFDILRDMRLSFARLRTTIEGSASFDDARIAHARSFAEQARMEAEMCVSLLEELCPMAAPQAKDMDDGQIDRPTAPVRPKKRPKLKRQPSSKPS